MKNKGTLILIIIISFVIGFLLGYILLRYSMHTFKVETVYETKYETMTKTITKEFTTKFTTTITMNLPEITQANISELISNPKIYENKLISITGEFHYIVTIPELKLPYNAVVASSKHQIGVLTNFKIKEGSKVLIIGIFTKGFQEKLSESGWIKDKEVYYIMALKIIEI
ncbi:MAG: hypothetical protein QXW69_00690 [Nitrososphaerota archaeon]